MVKSSQAAQRALFPEPDIAPRSDMPEGFRYEEGAITETEESALVEFLQTIELKPFEFHGYTGNRRVKSFGFRYDYSRSQIEAVEDFPPLLKELRQKVAKFAGLDAEKFLQGSINEYPPGAGIGWHRDKPQFGIIVGISLLAPATMHLRRAEGKGWIRRSQLLQPRSIYCLSGEARMLWEHSIPPVDRLRYSLTFRTLSAKLRPY
jgi:alkylated DNA repair dioxygenase AlkB